MGLSFIICTYNPDRGKLRRTLDSIGRLGGAVDRELVVVDNRSKPALRAEEVAVPGLEVRLVVEEEPGLTAARLRGFRETQAELLVYVDDDNVLAPDYAERALAHAREHPEIGVFSAGNIRGEFDRQPEPWMKPYLPFLALTGIEEDRWAMDAKGRTMPVGAGMVVRRPVMEAYAGALASDRSRQAMDRDGKSLLAGGDTDIGYASLELGLGCGWCRDLRLDHLISADRLEPDYLVRLARDVTASHVLLARLHGEPGPSVLQGLKRRTKDLLGRLAGPESSWGCRGAIARGQLAGERLFARSLGAG